MLEQLQLILTGNVPWMATTNHEVVVAVALLILIKYKTHYSERKASSSRTNDISVLDWWLIQNKPRRSSTAVETTSRVRRRIWRTERCRPLVGTLASQHAHFLLHTAQHRSCDSTCQSTLQFIIWQQPITEHWKLKTHLFTHLAKNAISLCCDISLITAPSYQWSDWLTYFP